MCLTYQKPLIGVHHIAGHIYANLYEKESIESGESSVSFNPRKYDLILEIKSLVLFENILVSLNLEFKSL